MSASDSPWSAFLEFLSRLFGAPPPPPPQPDRGVLTPLQPRVLMIVYNPVVDTASGKKLIEAMGWNDPEQLAAAYIADVAECSDNVVTYRIAQRVELDEFPVKVDGFRYEPAAYVQVAQTNSGAHDPDTADYQAILARFNLLTRVAAGDFDEVWLFGGPYFGFWESGMAGAGAFFCNGAPIPNTAQCPRKFVLMGFNYQRGVGEMLEDIGHRAESTLARVFHSETFLQWAYDFNRQPPTVTGSTLNLFERFLCFDQIAPSRANVGTVHYAPNSRSDYEWGVTTSVPSCADDWLQFPNLPDPPNYRAMNARDWGDGDIRAHHKWWLKRLPKAAGMTGAVANNWWKYIVDPNNVK